MNFLLIVIIMFSISITYYHLYFDIDLTSIKDHCNPHMTMYVAIQKHSRIIMAFLIIEFLATNMESFRIRSCYAHSAGGVIF